MWCGVMAPYSTGMEIASGPRATQNSDAITEKRQRRLQNLRPWRRLLTACGSNPLLNAVVTLALNTALRNCDGVRLTSRSAPLRSAGPRHRQAAGE